MAEGKGLLVLRGRAIESGGAYRPVVGAFARPSAPFSQDPRLAAARPTLARVFWGGLTRPESSLPWPIPLPYWTRL
jgi:hypothetical protein